MIESNYRINFKNNLLELNQLPNINLGYFNHPKLEIPFWIDLSNTKGICFEVDEKNEREVYFQMEYMTISMLSITNPKLLKFKVVDFGLSDNLNILNNLQQSGGNIQFVASESELSKTLDDLYEDARRINTSILTSRFNSLIEFNEKNTDIKQPFQFLIIANPVNELSKKNLSKLKNIVDECTKTGIYTILTYNKQKFTIDKKNYLDNHNDKISEEQQAYFDMLQWFSKEMLYTRKTLNGDNICDNIQGLVNKEFYERLKQYNFNFNRREESQTDLENIILKIKERLLPNRSAAPSYLKIKIGRHGVNPFYLEMGQKQNIHHCLIAGKTGSGKSVLLNNIITQIGLKYSPDDIRLFLFDFKQGVSLRKFQKLPHTQILLKDNLRLDAGIKVLEYFTSEIRRRSNLFNEVGGGKIEDIDSYNKKVNNCKKKLHRILLIIDEVQVLFKAERGKYESIANNYLDQIARQGRAFGLHMLFCSQSYNGVYISNIQNEVPLRISLKLNTNAACDSIMGYDNANYAPKKLPEYGEAIYNVQAGARDGNIQVFLDYNPNEIENRVKEASNKWQKGSICKIFQQIIIDENYDLNKCPLLGNEYENDTTTLQKTNLTQPSSNDNFVADDDEEAWF